MWGTCLPRTSSWLWLSVFWCPTPTVSWLSMHPRVGDRVMWGRVSVLLLPSPHLRTGVGGSGQVTSPQRLKVKQGLSPAAYHCHAVWGWQHEGCSPVQGLGSHWSSWIEAAGIEASRQQKTAALGCTFSFCTGSFELCGWPYLRNSASMISENHQVLASKQSYCSHV